jgi:hypothetical protein
MEMLWQALLGLFVIAAIVFCVLGAQVWRVPTVLTVVGLFLGAVTFFVLAAMTLKAHASWRSLYNEKQQEIAKAEAEHNELLYGNPDAEATDAAPDEVDENGEPIDPVAATTASNELLKMGNRQLRYELAAVREDRGKTWYGTGTLALPNGEVNITAPSAVQIVANMPLYIFEAKEGGSYVGEFKVTGVEGTNVKLALTETLTADQQQALAGKAGEWIVRSIMPVDSHEVFRGLSKEELAKLIPQAATGLDAAGYDALLEQYVRDGQAAKAGDPADRVFKQVKITKETTIEYTDEKGEKKTQTLQSSDDVERPTTILVNSEKAQELVSQHGAEIVDNTGVYLRPLRNYENSRRMLNVRMFALTDRIAQVKAQTAAVETAIKSASEVRMASLTKEETGLKADSEKMARDRDVIKKYLSDLAEQQTQLQSAFMKHYADSIRMAAEITKLQLDLAKKIEGQAAAKSQAKVVPVAR